MPNLTEGAQKEKPYELIIVDGKNMCFKYEYGMGNLKNKDGISTGMFHGFLQMLLTHRIKNINARIVIAWEGDKLVRKQKIEGYKDNRPKVSNSFNNRCKKLKDMLGMLGVEQKFGPGYEADDVAACLVKENHCKTLLISEDRDWYQFMHENVSAVHKGKVFSYNEVLKREGFPPERYNMYVLLKGKQGNNVKGILSFPTKLAREVVNSCRYLGDAYRYKPKDPGDQKWIDLMKEKREELNQKYNVLKLRSDIRLEDLLCHLKNASQLKKLLIELQMFKVLKLLKSVRRLKKS